MSFKNQWNEEVDKKDLKMVAIKGALTMVIAAIIGSLVDYVLFRIGGNFTVGDLILGALIGIMVSGAYKNEYHVKFTVLICIYVFFGLVLLAFLRLALINNFEIWGLLINPNTYFLLFLYPIYILISAIGYGGVGNYFFAILEIVFYILTFVMAVFIAKRKRD